MSIGRYATWWRQPWVPALCLSGAVARVPVQMYPVAVLLLVRERTGSIAAAGAVTAAATLGYAAAAPVQGRLVDRYGQTVPLTVTALASAAAFTALVIAAITKAPTPVLATLAAAAGMAVPPVPAAQRTLWRTVLPDARHRQTAFLADGLVLDVGLITGPAAVTGLAVLVDPAAAVAATATMLIVGTVWFSRLAPSRAHEGERSHRVDLAGPLRSAGTRTLVAGATLTGVVLGALRVGFVAVADEHQVAQLGGLYMSVFGLGSLAGGIALAAWPRPGDASRRWTLLLAGYTAGLALVVVASWSLPLMAAAALVAGCALTPQVVTEFELIPMCAPPATVTEAYAWSITAHFAGDAAGSALAGGLVETSARLPLATAATASGLAAILAWRRRSTLDTSRHPAAAPAPSAPPRVAAVTDS